jgi:anti-anti-sigma regulatory factor
MTDVGQTVDEGVVAGTLRVVKLSPKLDVQGATRLKTELEAVLSEQGAVLIEASAVTRASTSACQVLVAFVMAMRHAGRTAAINTPSGSLLKSFAALGFAGFLEGEA